MSRYSTGQTVDGTDGSPGPNTSNALNHGTTGSNMGATSATQGAVSHGNAVDTPAANSATNSLGNTDTGIHPQEVSPHHLGQRPNRTRNHHLSNLFRRYRRVP